MGRKWEGDYFFFSMYLNICKCKCIYMHTPPEVIFPYRHTRTHTHICTHHTRTGWVRADCPHAVLCTGAHQCLAEQHWHCIKALSSPTEPTGCSGQELGSRHPQDSQPKLCTGPAHTIQCHPAIKAGKRGRRKEAPVMKASDLLQNCYAC